MFGRNHKDECSRIRENLSLYLDAQLEPIDRDSVAFHCEKCAECRYELESLEITRDLLHQMPAVAVPRSFVLTQAPAKRFRFSFEMPSFSLEGAFRMAAATAVILFALLITLDMSGVLTEQESHVGETVAEPGDSNRDVTAVTPVPSTAPTEEPVIVSNDIRDHEATQPDGPQWDTDPMISSQVVPDTQEEPPANIVPEQTGNLNPNGESGVSSPTPRSITPSWLLPMEIAVGVLVLLFGSASLVMLRKRHTVI